MGEILDIQRLSLYTGEPPEHLLEWGERGVIGEDGFSAEDVEKVRLIQTCLRRGLTAAQVSAVGLHGLHAFTARSYLPEARAAGPLPEVAERLGLDVELARRLWEASGLGDQGDIADRADVAMLRGAQLALDAGFPEEGLLELFRVLADSLGRTGEALQRAAHVYGFEVPVLQGTRPEDAMTDSRARAQVTGPLVEPMILYFYRKAALRALRDDFAEHVALESGALPLNDVPGRLRRAFAFVDLSDFTPLTASTSDLQAASVLNRFAGLVRRCAVQWDGRVVKQIGDEFMLVFHDSRSAVCCLAEIHRETQQEPQFPAVRSGIHFGEVLYREGDYVGTVVNTAARIRGVARRHALAVSGEVRRDAGRIPGVSFVRVGRRALKGLPEDLEVFEVNFTEGGAAARASDPVCGVEMAPREVAASLTLEGVERAFCSDDCLRKFIMSPTSYAKARSDG